MACGGPITLKGFGNTRRVSCPHCGSTLEPDQSGALRLLQQAQRQRRQSALALHARGEFEGVMWEIVGIIWREARVEGVAYPWQEFLLFNPYKGFRWLVFQMTDGHWMFGGALDGAPRAEAGVFSHRSVSFRRKAYRHFQSAPAHVTYVEGELTWQAQVSDQAMAHDYVAPPEGVSIEQAETDEGAELAFTGMRHVEAKQVWQAFKMPGTPPRTSGVGMLAPNPHRARAKWYWLSLAVLLLLWAGASVLYVAGRPESTVFERRDVPIGESISEEIELLEPGRSGTVELSFGAGPLDNGWAYADVLLVDVAKEEALAFGAEVDNWNGVADGESYNEGTNPTSVTMGNVDGGKYRLQISTQVDPNTPTPPQSFSVKIRQDVVLWRYVLLSLLVILVGPFLNLALGAFFEGRRWQNSDYANTGD